MNIDALLPIALDLTSSLIAESRYQRLLSAIMGLIPCDAACLLLWDKGILKPVASQGLVPEILGYRFVTKDHPRLELICRSKGPLRFPATSQLPDPFDDFVHGEETLTHKIHACLGCPLKISGDLVGVLTLDAFDPKAFNALEDGLLDILGALSAATIRAAQLIEALEHRINQHGVVTEELLRAAHVRSGGDILGVSKTIERTRQDLELAAQSDLAVLITGETGVGKELVARAIHWQSRRRKKALIYVNCAALPEALAESELFGHSRGSFTGAERNRAGKFRAADGGTIFLDEVGELPLSLQAKLLRTIQNGEIQSIGQDKVDTVDVRIVAATNRDLRLEVEAGRFRSDLYHRLYVFPINVPALRDRKEDIPLLSGHFLDKARRRMALQPARMTAALRRALCAYSWPGNVRELENLIHRILLKAMSRQKDRPTLILGADLVDFELNHGLSTEQGEAPEIELPEDAQTLGDAVEAFKRQLIAKRVEEAGGNWSAAARSLGVHRGNLHHLARRLGMK